MRYEDVKRFRRERQNEEDVARILRNLQELKETNWTSEHRMVSEEYADQCV
jgi:hypothetical protein